MGRLGRRLVAAVAVVRPRRMAPRREFGVKSGPFPQLEVAGEAWDASVVTIWHGGVCTACLRTAELRRETTAAGRGQGGALGCTSGLARLVGLRRNSTGCP